MDDLRPDPGLGHDPSYFTLVYYLVPTPIGLVGRVFGEHFLHLKRSKESATYRVRREGPGREKSDYERQL